MLECVKFDLKCTKGGVCVAVITTTKNIKTATLVYHEYIQNFECWARITGPLGSASVDP